MVMRRYITIITALSLCGSGLHGMQSMKNLRGLYCPALIGAGICGVVYLGSRVYAHTYNLYLNTYSITYSKKESVRRDGGALIPEIIFDNITLKKGRDEFTFSGTIWEYNTNKDAVGKIIRSGLVDHVAPFLRAGKSVVIKLSDIKTAHFIGKSHTEEEIMSCILDVLLKVEGQTHIKSCKV